LNRLLKKLKLSEMTYKVFIRRSAQKQLSKLPASDYFKIKQSILNLAHDPRPADSVKLKNREGWRIRRGNYRIIYEIQDDKLIVLILRIGHRKDIYRP